MKPPTLKAATPVGAITRKRSKEVPSNSETEMTYLYLLFQKQPFTKAQDLLLVCDYELHHTLVAAYLASVQDQQYL